VTINRITLSSGKAAKMANDRRKTIKQTLGGIGALEIAKSNPRVSPHLEGKAIKRVIYVPNKILNVVVG
jgi:leucyl-tRNA synthetase